LPLVRYASSETRPFFDIKLTRSLFLPLKVTTPGSFKTLSTADHNACTRHEEGPILLSFFLLRETILKGELSPSVDPLLFRKFADSSLRILFQAIFPLGNYLKSEVKSLAKDFALPTAERSESMGICFVEPSGRFPSFLGASAAAFPSRRSVPTAFFPPKVD
jgi:hypothetical protein